MGEVWPEAQAHVARELGTEMPEAIVFAPNTHDFIVRIVSACPRRGPALRVLTSDGEFHSARRQFARWAEDGWLERGTGRGRAVRQLHRPLPRARGKRRPRSDLRQPAPVFERPPVRAMSSALAALARPEGPWVVVDGYHAFMAIPEPFAGRADGKRLLSRRRLQICDGGGRLRLPPCAAGLWPAAADHRLVRRVRGFEPSPGKRRLCPRCRRASSARPSTRRGSTASTRCGGCSTTTA